MKFKKGIFAVVICILISGAAFFITDANDEMLFTLENSPYYINEDLKLEADIDLIIEAGVKLYIDSGVNIVVHGNFIAIGTDEQPIEIHPNSEYGWGQIIVDSPGDSITIDYTHVEEGRIYGKGVTAIIENLTIKNSQDLVWDDALIWLDQCIVNISNSNFKSNLTGEGILVLRSNNVRVSNCDFDHVNDAVEYMSCDSSYITGCTFINGNDDAIDLNGCNNVLISYNVISNYLDRGMEIGSEGFGSSAGITLYRNEIFDCNVGICIKDGSESVLLNNTIVSNRTGIAVLRLDTLESGSNVEIINSIFYQNSTNIFIDEFSKANCTHSISNDSVIAGDGNIVGDPLFVDADSHDFSLTKLSPCRFMAVSGSPYDPEANTVDIGAKRFEKKIQH